MVHSALSSRQHIPFISRVMSYGQVALFQGQEVPPPQLDHISCEQVGGKLPEGLAKTVTHSVHHITGCPWAFWFRSLCHIRSVCWDLRDALQVARRKRRSFCSLLGGFYAPLFPHHVFTACHPKPHQSPAGTRGPDGSRRQKQQDVVWGHSAEVWEVGRAHTDGCVWGWGDSQLGLWAAGSCVHTRTRCFFHQIVCSATLMHTVYNILSPFITAILLLSWPSESLLIGSNTSAVPSGGCILMNFLLAQQYSCAPIGFREQGWGCEAEHIPHGAEVTVPSCSVLYYPVQCVIPVVGGCAIGMHSSPPPFVCMVEMEQRRTAPFQAEWGRAHPCSAALRCCIA